jgi:hypothetical protein
MCGGAGVMCGWRRTRGRWHTVEMKIRENAWIWATGGGRLQTAERDAATDRDSVRDSLTQAIFEQTI